MFGVDVKSQVSTRKKRDERTASNTGSIIRIDKTSNELLSPPGHDLNLAHELEAVNDLTIAGGKSSVECHLVAVQKRVFIRDEQLVI
jgi:hypothetical protein